MDALAEPFDSYLIRVARKIGPRLIRERGGPDDLLAEIRMTARVRATIDEVIRLLIKTGSTRPDLGLLDEILDDRGPLSRRPTWKEIGQALGVSAQAANRKYRSLARATVVAGGEDDLDRLLLRVGSKLPSRLIREESGPDGVLAEIQMAVRFRTALDRVIESLIATGDASRIGALLLPEDDFGAYDRPTWKEIGKALGVSAQAAHKKYARPSAKR
jgi:hypothetical protein